MTLIPNFPRRELCSAVLVAGLLSSCASEDEFGWRNPRRDSFAERYRQHRVRNEAKNDAWFDRVMNHPVGNAGMTTGYPESR